MDMPKDTGNPWVDGFFTLAYTVRLIRLLKSPFSSSIYAKNFLLKCTKYLEVLKYLRSVPVCLPVIINSGMWQIWLAWSFVAFWVCLHIWSFLIQVSVPETCSNLFMLKSFEVLFFTVFSHNLTLHFDTNWENQWMKGKTGFPGMIFTGFAGVSCPVQNTLVLLFRLGPWAACSSWSPWQGN